MIWLSWVDQFPFLVDRLYCWCIGLICAYCIDLFYWLDGVAWFDWIDLIEWLICWVFDLIGLDCDHLNGLNDFMDLSDLIVLSVLIKKIRCLIWFDLIDWWIDVLSGGCDLLSELIAWLMDWLFGDEVFIDWMIVWVVGWLVGRLLDFAHLVGWFDSIDLLHLANLNDLFHWLFGILIWGWLMDWSIWMIDGLIDWLTAPV